LDETVTGKSMANDTLFFEHCIQYGLVDSVFFSLFFLITEANERLQQ